MKINEKSNSPIVPGSFFGRLYIAKINEINMSKKGNPEYVCNNSFFYKNHIYVYSYDDDSEKSV